MQLFHSPHFIKNILLFGSFAVFTGFSSASIAIDITAASQQVKTLPCKDNLSVDQTLDHSIKNHSQRDLGWRTFQEDGFFDIERAVLIHKGMELRYRWRVLVDGKITPQNDRAAKLCQIQLG